jgi:hypothetical protein
LALTISLGASIIALVVVAGVVSVFVLVLIVIVIIPAVLMVRVIGFRVVIATSSMSVCESKYRVGEETYDSS